MILAVAAYLRLSHLNWDQGTHIHPDERFLTMVTSAMQLPDNLQEFFDSTRSRMNPYNVGYDFFVYGTLPLFIVRVAAEAANQVNAAANLWNASPGQLLNMAGYDGVHLVGRALSGMFDLACVVLIFLIAQRLYGRKVGVLAALLYTFTVLPLQQSHFYTVDTFGAFFALLTFYFAVRVAQGGRSSTDGGPRAAGGGWLTYIALGASLGASIACRINLAPMAGIVLLAASMRTWDDWRMIAHDRPAVTPGRSDRIEISTLIQATLFRLVLMGVVAFAVFRMAQPYAFGGTTVLDFSLARKWLSSMKIISLLISGDAEQPPAIQWAERTKIIFPWVNIVVWGMGLPLGLVAWAGWAVAAWQVVRGLASRNLAAHPELARCSTRPSSAGRLDRRHVCLPRPPVQLHHALLPAYLSDAGDDGGVVPLVAGGKG